MSSKSRFTSTKASGQARVDCQPFAIAFRLHWQSTSEPFEKLLGGKHYRLGQRDEGRRSCEDCDVIKPDLRAFRSSGQLSNVPSSFPSVILPKSKISLKTFNTVCHVDPELPLAVRSWDQPRFDTDFAKNAKLCDFLELLGQPEHLSEF